ncbi:MAG: phospholipase [Bacteroidia bacterium]|nr:phospholipase [Bacteroidia bacterium]
MSEAPVKIKLNHLEVTRTARYATLGSLNDKTRFIWIVCHGYGQIASDFIKDFQVLSSEEHFVIAPEGLSRFYWGGNFDGKPVASWMTREDRLNEIRDYSKYLSQLFNLYKKRADPKVEFILFGFSQGCATIMRWCNIKRPSCKAIINWAGTIPEDIEYDQEYFVDIKLFWRYGTKDRFFTKERIQWHLDIIREKNLKIDIDLYEGKHKLYAEGLLALEKVICQSD